MKVVLIDDNPIELHVLEMRLTKLGICKVVAFSSPKEAYSYISANHVDLIIFDLEMPQEDGLAVLSHLHSIQFGQPICILSGMNREIIDLAEKVGLMFGLNMVSCYSKPLEQDQLENIVWQSRQIKQAAKQKPRKTTLYPLEEITQGLQEKQFCNHYQPQYCFKAGRLIGVEALVRWNHPQDGLMFPDSFISQLEESEHTFDLLKAVVDNVIHDAQHLPDHVSISINVSADDLSNHNDFSSLLSQFAQSDIKPERINFEITEMRVYKLTPEMLRNIARLRMSGFGLSIDDFGVGHSGLSNLVSLPFTELKIDRQFVNNYLINSKHRHAIELSVQLAKKLNMKVVAEGVENKDEFNAMQAIGVDICQGYFTGRPTTIEQLITKDVL
ncbi:EAL domain-containing protein [Vibrio aquaticus]|uniref:EAL domain-containing protein n=1 Tax=Vibrio aquaticus TaxID=2496559 RepID=A0A432D0T4_9VIBR|nr:EAL domain-containing response regulator [Vibrio aquaticus]RTZ17524.1 EAL domain-containing protein [Vibrio aquaticus]